MNLGAILANRYRLEQEIGSGGIGTVYRAADTRSRATVAVKLLHPHLVKDRDYVRRFHRGARIAQGLRSPTSSTCSTRTRTATSPAPPHFRSPVSSSSP